MAWFVWWGVILKTNCWTCSPGFAISVLMKSLKFAKDQKQINKRKLKGSHLGHPGAVPQCHVAEQKECQGFNVPRLYHSALSLNAAVLVVLTARCREPHIVPATHLAFWWLVAGFGLAHQCWDEGMQAQTHLAYFSGSALVSLLLIWIMVFSLAPALTLPSWGLFLHKSLLLVGVCECVGPKETKNMECISLHCVFMCMCI